MINAVSKESENKHEEAAGDEENKPKTNNPTIKISAIVNGLTASNQFANLIFDLIEVYEDNFGGFQSSGGRGGRGGGYGRRGRNVRNWSFETAGRRVYGIPDGNFVGRAGPNGFGRTAYAGGSDASSSTTAVISDSRAQGRVSGQQPDQEVSINLN